MTDAISGRAQLIGVSREIGGPVDCTRARRAPQISGVALRRRTGLRFDPASR